MKKHIYKILELDHSVAALWKIACSMISCSTLTKCVSIQILSLRNQEIGGLLKVTTSFYANLMHLAGLSW